MAIVKIPAVVMRGGTNNGVFFNQRDLPSDPAARDRLLVRLAGHPDACPMMGASADGAEPLKVVVVGKSVRLDADVDVMFGDIDATAERIVWSSRCGTLAGGVGPFAVQQGLVPVHDGSNVIQVWQQDPGRRLRSHVVVRDGDVIEEGMFLEDGSAFPAADVRLDYLDEGLGGILPTGQPQDTLDVPDLGTLQATLLNAGVPTAFVRATDLGLTGRELPDSLRRQAKALAVLDAVRIEAAARMGASAGVRAAARLLADLRIVWIAAPSAYRTGQGLEVPRANVDVLARVFAGGQAQRSLDGPAAIATAAAAALPGSLVSQVARTLPGVATRIGHASGVLTVDASVVRRSSGWIMERASMSRSARCLMSGWLHVPASARAA
jgi:2-methylaconitate cis-trans-isomerase PrpF